MDPGTILAVVTETISVTASAIRYIKDVTDADEDRARIRNEAQLLLLPLTDLEEMIKDTTTSQNWTLITCLVNALPALNDFKDQMQHLVRRLRPGDSKTKNVFQKLKWPFDKPEINAILSRIERLKTLIILVMEGNTSRLLLHLNDNVNMVRQDLSSLKNAENERQLQKVLAWLSPLEFSSRHQAIRDAREKGTRQWFLTGSAFQGWLRTPNTTLLCIGAPASGKTFLGSFVIDHLLSTTNALPTLYIYCSYKEQQHQSVSSLMGSLLRQLSHYSAPLRSSIVQLYAAHEKNTTKPSAIEMCNILCKSFANFPMVYIVIDALDELTTKDETRDEIVSWLTKLGTCSNIIATSRPVSMITNFMPEATKLHIAAHEDDIRMYVANRMKNDLSLARKLGDDSSLKQAIMTSIVQRSKGIFLVGPLYMNALSDTVSKWQIRTKLDSFPVTLDDMYSDTITRIEAQNNAYSELARRVLIWVSCAVRPLTVQELQTAVAIEPGLAEMDPERLSDEHTLTSVCGGLLTVEPKTGFVRLIHYTAQGFLERLCAEKWPAARSRIIELLLVYLSFPGLVDPPDRMVIKDVDRFANWRANMLSKYPLLSYAGVCIAGHINHTSNLDENQVDLIISFFQNEIRNFNLLLVNGIVFSPHIHENIPLVASAMHIFAAMGLNVLIEKYLAYDRSNINSTWSTGLTPLALAVAQDRVDTVKLLIARGAAVVDNIYPANWVFHLGSRDRITYVVHLLHIAVLNDLIPVINVLITAGAPIEFWTDNSLHGRGVGTALHVAVRSGNIEAIKALLAHGARLDPYPYSPLHTAVIGRNEAIFQLLIERKANVNARDIVGATALFSAVGLGRRSMVVSLLENGADANIVNMEGETALFKLVTLCMLPGLGTDRADPVILLDILIRYHADINFRDHQGSTVLNHAIQQIRKGRITSQVQDLIIHLLDNGADLLLQDHKGLAVLHYAADFDDTTLLNELLRRNVDINAQDHRGYTALHHAVRNGRISCARCLLMNGAEAGALDGGGRTPLHYAVANATDETSTIIDQLISNDTTIDVVDHNGQTPLHVATNQGWIRIERLIVRGANVNFKDNFGWTPLVYAVHRSHAQLVATLLLWHADPNIRTLRTHTAAHFAANSGNLAIMELLVQHGADLNVKDLEGNTILLYAARHKDMTQFLLEKGIQPAADATRYTSLHRAAVYGCSEVVGLLLGHGANAWMSKEAWDSGLVCIANSKIFDEEEVVPQSYEQTSLFIDACVKTVQEEHGLDLMSQLPLRERNT